MITTSRFQLFGIITKCICSFLDSKVRKQIGFHRERTLAGKEGQRALARYINARRKKEQARWKEEAQKKAEEEARRKVMVVASMSDEGQSSKGVQTWRK
jgi:mannitol-specific phosphotransferase system IIBC component